MVDAAPFRALHYDPAIAGAPAATSAPAYDDLGRFTYARHRTASPYTVLELLAPDEENGSGFSNAAAAYRRWLRTGVLVEEEAAAFYLYEIHELRHAVPAVLRGVLAAVSVTGDTLLPHEGIETSRITSRLDRMTAVPVDIAPVFAVHTPADAGFRSVVDAAPQTTPLIAFTDESGADHRIWAVQDANAQQVLRDGLLDVRAVIADGHHRFASAVHLQRRRHDQHRTLAYLVDAAAYGPQLLPVHRLVRRAPADLERRLGEAFTVTPVPAAGLRDALHDAPRPALGYRTADGHAAILVPRRQPPPGPAATTAGHALDPAVFEDVIRPLLDDADVVYLPDDRVTDAAPDAGSALFVMRAPALDAVYDFALAGRAMPAKSTWFRPKPRAGVVMRSLDSGA